MWTKKVRYGPPSTESKRGGAERKEEEEDFSLSVGRLSGTDASSPPPQQLDWAGGRGGGKKRKKPLLRLHHLFPPPPPSLTPSLTSHWLLHPIEFCLTLMMRFVDVECPLFVESIQFFHSPPPSWSFSLIQSLALDYHSSQRRVELLLIELYAVYSVVFAPAHRVVLAARHGWTTPRFHNSFIICWRLFWTLRSLPLTPDSLCDPC